MCVLKLQTECKAENVLAVVQIWLKELVRELMVSVIVPQGPLLVLKPL